MGVDPNVPKRLARSYYIWLPSQKKELQKKNIGSIYGILTYIHHKNQPNVGEYTSPMDPLGKVAPFLLPRILRSTL